MRFGNASTTVTGTVAPASVNTRVMPHLRPTRTMVIGNPHSANAQRRRSLQQIGGLDTRTPSTRRQWRRRPRAPTSKMDGGVYGRHARHASFAAKIPLIQLDLDVHA